MAKQTRKSKGPIFQVKALEAWTTPGNFCDDEGGGLYLQVRQIRENGVPQLEKLRNGQLVQKVRKYWVFRYWSPLPAGRRQLKEYGIGPFEDYSLQEARDKAKAQRKLIRDEGADPILTRKFRKQEIRDRIDGMKTFKEAAVACWEAHKSKWKERTANTWINSLETHIYPKLGNMELQAIKKTHIEAVLRPIWTSNPDLGARIRQRLEVVFNYARGKEWYPDKNPAEWAGNLDALMPPSIRREIAENFPSLPFHRMGAFMEALRHGKGISARALEFTILTAARSGEVRLATWDEIDFDKALWTVPTDRMKTEKRMKKNAVKDHIVPLSTRALEILRSMGDPVPGGLVFPAERSGKALSDMAMSKYVKDMDARNLEAGGDGWRDPNLDNRIAVPHGFRATFSTWGQDHADFDHQLVEFALSHKLEDEVKAAYKRGTMVEKRRPLMAAWADYCAKGPSAKPALDMEDRLADMIPSTVPLPPQKVVKLRTAQ